MHHALLIPSAVFLLCGATHVLPFRQMSQRSGLILGRFIVHQFCPRTARVVGAEFFFWVFQTWRNNPSPGLTPCSSLLRSFFLFPPPGNDHQFRGSRAGGRATQCRPAKVLPDVVQRDTPAPATILQAPSEQWRGVEQWFPTQSSATGGRA